MTPKFHTVVSDPDAPPSWLPTWALRLIARWRYEVMLVACNAYARASDEHERASANMIAAEHYLGTRRIKHHSAERALSKRLMHARSGRPK